MKKLQRRTKQLLVRPLLKNDYCAWKQCSLEMKKPQNKWDKGPKPASELGRIHFNKILKAQKKRRENDTFYDLGVFNKQDFLVGHVSIMEVSRGISHSAYLGYRIFNNYWRRGYGKEAVRLIIDIGFKDINLHRLEAGIEPRNFRSIKLAKSLGMRREGIKKNALFLRGKWVDLVMYTLTTEDLGIKFKKSQLKYSARS